MRSSVYIPKSETRAPLQGNMETETLPREQQQDQGKEEAYPEENNEVVKIALCLIYMRHSDPDPSPPEAEAAALPPPSPMGDPYVPLYRPRVPSLEGMMVQCSEPFGKQLTMSDVDEVQSRLLLKKEDAQTHIYPLLGGDPLNQMREGVPVKVFNAQGKEYAMCLKSWNCVEKTNVLTTGWMVFVKDMGLEVAVNSVTLWAFRHRQSRDLCFLIWVSRNVVVGEGAAPARGKKCDQKKNNNKKYPNGKSSSSRSSIVKK